MSINSGSVEESFTQNARDYQDLQTYSNIMIETPINEWKAQPHVTSFLN